MDRRTPPGGPGAPLPPGSTVSARLVTSAPEGLLRLDFSPPPSGQWTLVRAELARRLAEQAVSQAAAVGEADLAAFAVGRGRQVAAAQPAPTMSTTPEVRARSVAIPVQERAARLRHSEMLTGAALAVRLGVSPATVAVRRAADRLLGLESGAKRGFRYPAWQAEVVADRRRAALFEAVLTILRPQGPWAAYEFLTEVSTILGGRTPLEALGTVDLPTIDRAVLAYADQLGRA